MYLTTTFDAVNVSGCSSRRFLFSGKGNASSKQLASMGPGGSFSVSRLWVSPVHEICDIASEVDAARWTANAFSSATQHLGPNHTLCVAA